MNEPEIAPPDALRAAFAKPGSAPLPSGTVLHDQMVTAIELHANQFWAQYLRDALVRIDELENTLCDFYLGAK